MCIRDSSKSSKSLAKQKIAITSEATVILKPSMRGYPLAIPPRSTQGVSSAASDVYKRQRQLHPLA